MKGTLNIYMEEGIHFFFHTACEIENEGDRTRITFEESMPPVLRSIHSIGIGRDSIAIMRANEALFPGAGPEYHKSEMAYLRANDPSFRVICIRLQGIELALWAEGMQITRDETHCSVKLRCVLSYKRKKSEEHTLFFESSVV